ncbi:N-alpha-acetyltransferase 38-A, NatC auxiliary subunit-like [Symsagittifera roscoffensis]|uniref:N-alpha-acetyltransferase 38-A, NatC auxiliary subunit-like n=1 Tax=Symsagittifera roscoffensis TaxID=84072 RepID=UPI00307C4F2F
MKLPSIYDTSAALHSSSPALTSCDSSDPGDGPEFIRSCLNKQFAVTITDGRVVVGDFVCTDRDANIILGGTQEYVPGKPESESRQVGLVIVPGKHIKKILIRN